MIRILIEQGTRKRKKMNLFQLSTKV